MTQRRLDSVRSMYDERSDQYDENEVHVKQARDYLQWAQLKEGESVLDLACGTGLVALGAKSVVGPSGHVVGVDISEGMLNVARRKAEADGVEVLFLNHDISDFSGLDIIPKGSRGFDVITCAAALILLQNPLQALRHWKTLLCPGGRFITDVQTKDANLIMNIFAAIAPEVEESVPWEAQRWQSQDALEQLVVDAGLVVQKIFETDSYATTRYERAMAPDLFDRAVVKSMFKNFGREAIREKARALFIDRIERFARPSGTVNEECRYWVVIATVP
ncbi:ribosomal RNA large subunit methyltransferase J [Capronia coronata CBS 617.96]|uniref:Ribosomal RNA large subunit methyltransferase J n=1 Tax=Capronia coronata CBS 617.96 TaxID=1182541 RepID=W9YZC9_9EURO|nr:ribosomal RNA large subunit methyltransferase J [Capronia coronata CBS 617.96]EXJ95040.1 ribosomal RNA large subunit methyltransferase J [Capronia coronata CBS 617.96]